MYVLKSSVPNVVRIHGVRWNKQMREAVASLPGIVEIDGTQDEILEITKTPESKLSEIIPEIKEIVKKR